MDRPKKKFLTLCVNVQVTCPQPCVMDVIFSENTIVDKRPVRSMCGVRIQRSDCVLYPLWTRPNKEGTMLVYNLCNDILSRVEN